MELEDDIYLDGIDLKNAESDPRSPKWHPHYKPYKGKKERICDAHVGYSNDSCGKPIVHGCKNKASYKFFPDKSPLSNCYMLCETCLPRMIEAYENKVNWSKIARAATARCNRLSNENSTRLDSTTT